MPEPGASPTAGPPLLSDVVRALDRRYPPELAESWDAVGTVCGDPDQPVRRVLLAIDATTAVVDEALEWGADLLWTHHPLLLRAVHGVAATSAKGSSVHRLIRGGCALHVTHTNADAPDGGVPDALAAALGVVDRSPLVPRPAEPPDTVAASAGEVGGGRVGDLQTPMTLGDFARRVAQVLPATAQGVRVSGDLDAQVRRVAVVGGSGDSFFDAVRAADADVYVTGDLRHHPALELRERARFEAVRAGRPADDGRPFLVDVAHSATEWPWLARAAADLVADLRSLGTTVETRVSAVRTDPWTAHVPSPTGGHP